MCLPRSPVYTPITGKTHPTTTHHPLGKNPPLNPPTAGFSDPAKSPPKYSAKGVIRAGKLPQAHFVYGEVTGKNPPLNHRIFHKLPTRVRTPLKSAHFPKIGGGVLSRTAVYLKGSHLLPLNWTASHPHTRGGDTQAPRKARPFGRSGHTLGRSGHTFGRSGHTFGRSGHTFGRSGHTFG